MPGRKDAYRLFGADGHALVDLLQQPDEPPVVQGTRVLCRHPFQVSLVVCSHWLLLFVGVCFSISYCRVWFPCFFCFLLCWVRTDPGKSWKVVEFKIQIFQAWKVMKLGLAPGKSCKINQMVAAFLTLVRFWPLHTLSLFTVRLSSICCLV